MRIRLAAEETGAALLEATLILPVLLLLVIGLAEVSLYLWTAGLAEKAVQLGVRRAVVSAPVASGPGLALGESAEIWHGLPPGGRCSGEATAACPRFAVRCRFSVGCSCSEGGSCGFRVAATALRPILAAMRAVLPDLRPEDVEVLYRANGFGYATRPGPVPADVEVALVGYGYRPLFFGDLMGRVVSIDASARLPGESLGGLD